MSPDKFSDITPVNARKTDVFDVFDFKHYIGPNPYLETGAIVFRFALTGYKEPLPLEDYVAAIAPYYPTIRDAKPESLAQLFAQTALEVTKLDMGLHCQKWSFKTKDSIALIATESIHEPTSYGAVYAVWDWFESISVDQPFNIQTQIQDLQTRFRRSVYGGPTVYALLRSARQKGIPAFYLSDEGLMQYGYGKNLVRGVATTFDSDSHLDSDFTTRKDDCKAFLSTLGFPVPRGAIVSTFGEAVKAAYKVGYPVAVKPVVGHKGIGVTADIQDEDELQFAFDRAVEAHSDDRFIAVIVEQNISGLDHRLLCVNGKFVAATQRESASVTGDGRSTIAELIDLENTKPERLDTPTSPLGKIITDDSLKRFLQEQDLTLNDVLASGRSVYLRKVANLSSGGVSVDATSIVHPDNIMLAQDVAQHFRLVCLGIDVLTSDISRSWKEGNFGIIEINSAPGVYMHLRPAVGESVDVASKILETFFTSGINSRIPIVTFNDITVKELRELVDHILSQHPNLTIGAACRNGVFVNRAEKSLSGDYNTKIQSLLRNPKLDLLIAEYDGTILEREGCFYDSSNIVILDAPTESELTLTHQLAADGRIVIKDGETVSVRSEGLVEQSQLGAEESFSRVYWKEVLAIL